MATLIGQILIALQLTFGSANNAQAQAIVSSGSYTIVNGVVIIDTDEL